MGRVVLQIGVLPPPIGGVTMHIARLLNWLKKDGIDVDVLNYHKERNIYHIIRKIGKADLIHIHLSNKIVRTILILLCYCFRKNIVTTFHGNYTFSSIWDKVSLKVSSFVIVLNSGSYQKASLYKRKNVFLIGAFIPPFSSLGGNVDVELEHKIKCLGQKVELLFCTNASCYALNRMGREIYMGTDILRVFKEHVNWGLVFSDGSSSYRRYFNENHIAIPENVLLISEPHDFNIVLKNCDVFLRATTTDGDSLSVKEALYMRKAVIATNCVERPKGTILIKSLDDLNDLELNLNLPASAEIPDNNYFKIKELYMSVLNDKL